MRSKWKDAELTEPIDYDAIAAAYRAEKWGWREGYRQTVPPDVVRIQHVVASLSNHVLINESGYAGTGGLTARLIDEKIVISIHGSLAQHLSKTNFPATRRKFL